MIAKRSAFQMRPRPGFGLHEHRGVVAPDGLEAEVVVHPAVGEREAPLELACVGAYVGASAEAVGDGHRGECAGEA